MNELMDAQGSLAARVLVVWEKHLLDVWKDHAMKHSNRQKISIWDWTTAYPEPKLKVADLIQKLSSILLPMTSEHISIKAIEIARSFGCTKERFT